MYKKMRSQFADTYNLVTVQCNYFGWEYMQSQKSAELDADVLAQVLDEKEVAWLLSDFQKNKYILEGETLDVYAQLNESLENLNDMGPAQAMDQLTSLKVVTDIIDNSSYVFPGYFNYNRALTLQAAGGYFVKIIYDYMVKYVVFDKELYDLNNYMRRYIVT